MDADPSQSGCAAGNECARAGTKLTCQPTDGATRGLKVQFCHAGACKVTLAPGFDLDLKADWTSCTGSPVEAPLGAPTAGVMLWPTALTDLAIPLADSGWFCKLAPQNGDKNGCIVNASQTARDLYIWGPIESTCTYAWGRTPSGIDATAGPGCGMCKLTSHAAEDSAEYAFNMGSDRNCRCPKISFAAIAAKQNPVP